MGPHNSKEDVHAHKLIDNEDFVNATKIYHDEQVIAYAGN